MPIFLHYFPFRSLYQLHDRYDTEMKKTFFKQAYAEYNVLSRELPSNSYIQYIIIMTKDVYIYYTVGSSNSKNIQVEKIKLDFFRKVFSTLFKIYEGRSLSVLYDRDYTRR